VRPEKDFCLKTKLDFFLLSLQRPYKMRKSYLSYQCQLIRDKDGKVSEVGFTIRNVPQGGINSTLLFSVYINDLPLVLRYCLAILFADDTQLIISCDPRNITQKIAQLESDLEAVSHWMTANELELNVQKTQIIVLGNASNVQKLGQITVNFNGQSIHRQETIKSLGLTIDLKLTWLDHINKLSRSFHLTARSLFALKPVLSQTNYLSVINAYLMSKLDYLCTIWGSASTTSLKLLERSIRRTARSVLGLNISSPVGVRIRTELGWHLPRENYYYFLLNFLYRISMCRSIPCFSETCQLNSNLHTHNTRNKSVGHFF